LTPEIAGKGAFERRTGKRENDQQNKQRSKDQEEKLPELESPNSGFLELFEKRERAELDRTQLAQIEEMEEDWESRGEETKESKGIKKSH
jgi:hypothetical protein